MKCRVLRWACVWGLLASLGVSSGAEEADASMIVRIKEATAFVQIKEPSVGGVGSAFLFRKDGKRGCFLTCNHVVQGAKRVVLVLGSGTPSERSLPARVTACDPVRDLACLEVEGDDLPAPLSLPKQTEIRETERVYVAGYPFGALVTTNGKNPEISVSTVTVSSLRKNPQGGMALVQLSGDVNPGNSGGPAVDAKGRVVGIAQSKMESSQTSFALAVEEIYRYFRGRMGEVSFQEKTLSPIRTEVEVSVALIDPAGALRSVRFAYVRQEILDAMEEPPSAGRETKEKACPAMREILLEISQDREHATGKIMVERGEKDLIPLYLGYQCRVQGEGEASWSSLAMTSVSFQMVGGGASEVRKPGAAPPEVPDTLQPTSRLEAGGVLRDLALSPDGSRLFVLDLSGGRILKLKCPDLAVDGEARVQDNCSALALSSDGKCLFVIGRGSAKDPEMVNSLEYSGLLQRFSATTLTSDATMDLEWEPGCLACLSDGRVVVGPAREKGDVLFVDMDKRVVTGTVTSPSALSAIRVHPDQTRLYFTSGGGQANFQRVQTRREARDGHACETIQAGGPCCGALFRFSQDGQFLVCREGSVLRVSKSRDADLKEQARIDVHQASAFSGPFLYLACANRVLKICRSSDFELLRGVKLDASCKEILVDPSGKWLYGITLRREPDSLRLLPVTPSDLAAYPLGAQNRP